jgi:hypothetical protein
MYLRGVAGTEILATAPAFPNCSSLRPEGQTRQSPFGWMPAHGE